MRNKLILKKGLCPLNPGIFEDMIQIISGIDKGDISRPESCHDHWHACLYRATIVSDSV